MNTIKNYTSIHFWLNDLSNEVCVANKSEDLDIHTFNMITRKMNKTF